MFNLRLTKRYTPKIKQVFREIPLRHIKIWKKAQARKLDRSRVGELAKSIKSEGLQNPPLVQKSGKNEHLLISGRHRLAALKQLGAKKAKFLVLTSSTAYNLEDAKAASVAENIHRANMETKEVASACIFLAEQVGKSEAAKKLGMSMATFKKYHGFAGVPEKLKNLVPKVISRDEATKLYQIIPNTIKAIKIANNISKLDSQSKKLYLRVLSQNPRSRHKVILKKMRKFGIKRKIPIELAKSNAKKLARLAEKKDMDPNKFANKIVLDYLKKLH